MYGAASPMLQNQSSSQHSLPQRPDITHTWNDVKPPVLRGNNNNTHRYLHPLSREEIVASIEASKKRHAEQKAKGLTPDNQQVFVRVRPSQKSLWGSLKEGMTYIANSLNEGVRQMDFLPGLPFSMAYGMPSSEKRIMSSEDEDLEKAFFAIYDKLEKIEHFVDDLKASMSSVKNQIEETRNKPPVPVSGCTSTSNNTTLTLPPGTVSYEQFRQYAESLGFEVEIWNPTSHDVCDTSCNQITRAWTGPSNTAVSIDGLPIILNRANPEKMFFLIQALIRPNDQIITTDERFGLKDECLNLVWPKNCVTINRICSNIAPDTIQPVRSQIGKKNTRIFVDFNEREQDSLIKNFANPGTAVPFIRVKHVGKNSNPINTTSSLALSKLDTIDDTVTFLDFLQYAEELGMRSHSSAYLGDIGDKYELHCRDDFDIKNTLLNDVPIIVSRGDPENSLRLLKAFVRPGDVIITTNSDFSEISKCLGLVQESACIDQSKYCTSIRSPNVFEDRRAAWLDIATGWANKIKSAMQAEPRRRIFIDMAPNEHQVLMNAYVIATRESGFTRMQMAAVGKRDDFQGAGGAYISGVSGILCKRVFL